MLVLKLRNFTGELWNWHPYVKGKKTPKIEAGHSRLVGGRFHKQGNLSTKLRLGCLKMGRSLHLSMRILEVYIEALTGFSYMYYPEGLNHTLFSQGSVIENGSHCRIVGQNIHFKDREGNEEPPIAWVQVKGQPAIKAFWRLLLTVIRTYLSQLLVRNSQH